MEQVRREIARAFPALSVQDIRLLGAGVDSQAFLVNDSLVFRFPRSAEVSRALAREIAILPRLAGRLTVATPRFTYIGRQPESGLLFVGYPLISGVPLTLDLFESLADAEQEKILATLAAFFEGVHNFPLDAARAAGIDDLSTRDLVASCWAEGHTGTLRLLSPDAGQALTGLIERFLVDARNFVGEPCLLYADVAPEHILYDRGAGAISGIIDWGDLAIGDPDYDLLYLYQDYGEAFVWRLLQHYSHPEPARLLEKLRVFTVCDYIRDFVTARYDPASETTQGAMSAISALLR